MSTAELNQKKLDLIAWINELSDESMIGLLASFKTSAISNDWWEKLSKPQQTAIQRGLEDVENGQVFSSEQFWKRVKNG